MGWSGAYPGVPGSREGQGLVTCSLVQPYVKGMPKEQLLSVDSYLTNYQGSHIFKVKEYSLDRLDLVSIK